MSVLLVLMGQIRHKIKVICQQPAQPSLIPRDFWYYKHQEWEEELTEDTGGGLTKTRKGREVKAELVGRDVAFLRRDINNAGKISHSRLSKS